MRDYLASKFEGPKLSGPLLVVCHFKLPVKKSVSKHRKAYLNLLPHWQKPDGDNLEKFLFDCCTRTVWTDDSQVSWMIRSKSWVNAEQGSVELFVTEIPESEMNYEEMMKLLCQRIKIPKSLPSL